MRASWKNNNSELLFILHDSRQDKVSAFARSRLPIPLLSFLASHTIAQDTKLVCLHVFVPIKWRMYLFDMHRSKFRSARSVSQQANAASHPKTYILCMHITRTQIFHLPSAYKFKPAHQDHFIYSHCIWPLVLSCRWRCLRREARPRSYSNAE